MNIVAAIRATLTVALAATACWPSRAPRSSENNAQRRGTRMASRSKNYSTVPYGTPSARCDVDRAGDKWTSILLRGNHSRTAHMDRDARSWLCSRAMERLFINAAQGADLPSGSASLSARAFAPRAYS